jgi:biopolymer transport protein ExbB
MKAWLSLLLSLFMMSIPAQALAANFAKVASQTSQDLKQARQEKSLTQKEIASTLHKLKSRLLELESSLKLEREGLARDQEELGRLSRRRADLSQEIAEKSGDLKELSGHVRASARDLLAMAEISPVTAEHPGRLKTLRGYLDSGRYPGLKEIKSLVELYLQEISANGQVIKRKGSLVNRAGQEVQGEIVRLGGFTTLYRAGEESGFLTLGPASGRLLAASGRPPWDMAGPLEEFMAGASVSAPVDISGGAALRQLSRQVGWWEHLKSGGPLIYPILAVGLLGLSWHWSVSGFCKGSGPAPTA